MLLSLLEPWMFQNHWYLFLVSSTVSTPRPFRAKFFRVTFLNEVYVCQYSIDYHIQF